jgi:LysM repeat protein
VAHPEMNALKKLYPRSAPFGTGIGGLYLPFTIDTDMKKAFYVGLFFFTVHASAQDGVQAEVENSKPYINHTIGSGETLSSLGRTYKLNVSDIASFNKLDADKGLQKDQVIRIPLKAANLSQADCSSCTKVYYKVQPREGLYRIGLNFGNVPTTTLQKLNSLSGESVDIGQNLLVGYLQVPANKAGGQIAQKPAEKQNPFYQAEPTKTDKKPANQSETVTHVEPPLVIQKAPPAKQQENFKSGTNTATIANNGTATQQTVAAATSQPVVANTATNVQGAGLFAANYDGKLNQSKTGTAAVFKSTSGWGDGKYYVLMNNAAPGTIVKIDYAASGKTVYAKVLGELPQIKQNENVLLRISNAAAAALGGGEDSFGVTVAY